MVNVITELSKYFICFLMIMYTIYCYTVFRNNDKERQKWIFRKQNLIMFLMHAVCYFIIIINTDSMNSVDQIKILLFYLVQVVMFLLVIIIYKLFYRGLSRLVLNNMLMLLSISFVMLTRLNYNAAIRQFAFACVGLILCLIVPYLINKWKKLTDYGWIYGGVGIFMMLIVLVIGKAKNGAKNWLQFGGISIQPSEFVKILFVFAIAALLSQSKQFKDIVKIAILAAVHVLILVAQKDLGGALIFSVTFIIMLYIATSNLLYFVGGFGGLSIASVIAYHLFSHVRVRVSVWQDPWADVSGKGWQIAQSLFAIGTGGWFGMGLTKGLPTSIPIVESDFIFSGISEEFGGVFAICLIFVYLSCFIMFINISVKMKKEFYKYVALGLSVVYIFQLFLALGGVTKFIPSTGVTIPLISAGGSSILSTIILFHIIQGMYVLNQDKDDTSEKEKRKNSKTRQSEEELRPRRSGAGRQTRRYKEER